MIWKFKISSNKTNVFEVLKFESRHIKLKFIEIFEIVLRGNFSMEETRFAKCVAISSILDHSQAWYLSKFLRNNKNNQFYGKTKFLFNIGINWRWNWSSHYYNRKVNVWIWFSSFINLSMLDLLMKFNKLSFERQFFSSFLCKFFNKKQFFARDLRGLGLASGYICPSTFGLARIPPDRIVSRHFSKKEVNLFYGFKYLEDERGKRSEMLC